MTRHQGVLDFLRSRGERLVNQVSAELMKNPQFMRAMQGAWRGKEVVDQAVSRAIKAMNIPTRTEFKRALARIEALEHELAEQKRSAARAPRPPAPRPAAARRKTSARKKGAPARRRAAAPETAGSAAGDTTSGSGSA